MFIQQYHPWIIISYSLWPIISTISLISLFSSIILWMHIYIYSEILVIFSLTSLIISILLWFRDVVREGTFQGLYTIPVCLNIRYGFLLFIGSELSLFVTLFCTYFNSSLYPSIWIGNMWPTNGIINIDPWLLPLLNTIILLSSATSLTIFHNYFIYNYISNLLMIQTIILGMVFILLQYNEFVMATFDISSSVYGSVFFITTGMHGIHVILGISLIIYSYIRIWYSQLLQHSHLFLESSIIYWHFVDVIWLFVFTLFYLNLL